MASHSGQDKGLLRAKLEFPVWYRGFTKSYAAWSNAPADLKTPLLLGGAALGKAESWLLACPEKLTDSQKRFIVRSISQSARQGGGGAMAAGGATGGPLRWRWHRTSDRPLWHLYAIIAVGIWVFAPDFISDALETALNEPEVREEMRREKIAAGQKPDASGQPDTTAAASPEATVAAATPEGDTEAEASPPAPETPLEPLAPRAPPAPPPPSPAERLARLAQEQMAAGHARAGLLLAIEAAELARAEIPEPNTPARSETLPPLLAALATREKLAPLASRDAVAKSALICRDGRTAITLTRPGEASVWRGGQAKAIAGVGIAQFDHVGIDGECRRLLVANEDFNVEIRSLATGAKLAELRGHEAGILAAAFSPDGNTIVTGGQDGTARVWDARTGRQRALLSGHDWHVTGAEFSADGRRVLTASEDKTARVWDAASGRELFQLAGHQGAVTTARFVAGGTRIVTTSWDGFVRLYEAATGKVLVTLRHPRGNLVQAAMSRDGARIATTDAEGGTQLWELHASEAPSMMAAFPGEARSITFTPDSRWLAVLDWSGQARLFATDGGKAEMTFGGGSDRIHTLEIARGGDSLDVITQAGARLGWPIMNTIDRALGHAKSIAPPCLNADERTLLGLGSETPAWCSEIKPRGAELR